MNPDPRADASPSDVDLLDRSCRNRDMSAFATLIDRHQTDLLRTAHALLGDAHAAQDAVQEGFLKLCHQAKALVASAQGRNSVGGWLATVVRNHCLDQLRRRPQREHRTLHIVETPAPSETDPAADLGPQLWQAVANLPSLERAAIHLRYRENCSYQVIAERLDKTATHVGVLLHSALARLRENTALRTELLS